jgi:tetratricopeptide (TPR) repeat protein
MLDAILNEYVFDTENPILNYKLGLEYEKIGQTASAVSYFLRAAERTDDVLLSYECLIRLGHCFDRQKNRSFTTKSMYRMAMTIMPDRPEAYYFLGKYLAFESNYAECYALCKLAYHNCKDKLYNDLNVGYPGECGLMHYEALSAWWYGKTQESLRLLRLLRNRYWDKLDDHHKESVKTNLANIESKLGISKKKIVDCFTFYEPLKEMLRLRLLMMKDYVDEFIISESNKTHSGMPLEYKLETLLDEMNLSDINVRIVKIDIPEDDLLEIKEIDKINCGKNVSNLNSLRARVRERMNIDHMISLVDEYDDDTVFIISDADEIIKPESVEYISGIVRNHQNYMIRIPIVHLEVRADLRLYDRETNQPLPWFGPIMVS